MKRLFLALCVALASLSFVSLKTDYTHTVSASPQRALSQDSVVRDSARKASGSFYKRKRYPCRTYDASSNHFRIVYRYQEGASKKELNAKKRLIIRTLEETAGLYYTESKGLLTPRISAIKPYIKGRGCKPVIELLPSEVDVDGLYTPSVFSLQPPTKQELALYFTDLPAEEKLPWCGQAFSGSVDWQGLESPLNYGGRVGQVRRSCWTLRTVAHEMTHLLGAVSPEAPHGTQSGHCWDEEDLMCYDTEATPTKEVCGGSPYQLDCNHDDYFSLNPEPGTWLSSHWNIKDSSFLRGGGLSPQATRSPELTQEDIICSLGDNILTLAWPNDKQVAGFTVFVILQDSQGRISTKHEEFSSIKTDTLRVSFPLEEGLQVMDATIRTENVQSSIKIDAECS